MAAREGPRAGRRVQWAGVCCSAWRVRKWGERERGREQLPAAATAARNQTPPISNPPHKPQSPPPNRIRARPMHDHAQGSTSTTSWPTFTLPSSCSAGGGPFSRDDARDSRTRPRASPAPSRLLFLLCAPIAPLFNMHPPADRSNTRPRPTNRAKHPQAGRPRASGLRRRPRRRPHQHLQQQPETVQGHHQRHDQQVLRPP